MKYVFSHFTVGVPGEARCMMCNSFMSRDEITIVMTYLKDNKVTHSYVGEIVECTHCGIDVPVPKFFFDDNEALEHRGRLEKYLFEAGSDDEIETLTLASVPQHIARGLEEVMEGIFVAEAHNLAVVKSNVPRRQDLPQGVVDLAYARSIRAAAQN